MDYKTFKSKWMNKGTDVDGAYGWQCWDFYAQWCRENGVPFANCTVSGYVKDLWEQRRTNGILKYFDEVEIMEEGDVAVFKEVAGWTPVSHVALFDHDAGGGFGWFFGQNQGSQLTNPAGGSSANLVKLPYSATYPTAFRLKKKATQAKPQGGNTTVAVPAKNINGEIYSGLITGVDPNAMNSDSNRTKIDRIVIHHNATTNDAVARHTWYVSSGHGTSAHYQVTPDKIWGCVGENYVAYHAGNYPMNQRSIGIEHLNNTGAPTWTIAEETYRNSAKLIRDICERYNIPIDRQHILKHGEVSSTACLPVENTELLTKQGWISLKDIQVGDEIATYRLDDGSIIFDTVYNKVEPHIKDTWFFRDVEVTADHRMLWKSQSSKTYKISEAKDMFSNKGTLVFPNAGNYEAEGLPVPDTFLQYLVAVQADGHYMKDNRTINKNPFGIEFHIKKERKVELLTDILDELGKEYTFAEKKDGTYSFRIYGAEEVEEVEQYLDNKKFSWKFLEMSERQAELFLDYILDFDGCRAGNDYSSSLSQNIDVVQAIASLHNKGSRTSTEGRRLHFTNPYRSVNSTGTLAKSAQRKHGKLVSCVSVTSGLILIRQHGRTTIVGNCPGGIDIDRLVAMARGAEYLTPAKATPRPSAPGKMQHAYRVDDLKYVNGLWQVYSEELAPAGFDWTENGIAVEDIIITDKNGVRSPNQVTHVGDYFVFDQTATADTGYGAMGTGGWYWRKFRLRTSGEIWLSAWNLNHLLFG